MTKEWNVYYKSVEDYKALFEMVCEIVNDADGLGRCEQTQKEDLAKCKWIAAIHRTLCDVPMMRAEHIFEKTGIDFDLDEFFEEELF